MLTDYRAKENIDFICSLRPICEVLYCFFLKIYQTGLEVSSQDSVLHDLSPATSNEVREQEARTTFGWFRAKYLAHLALRHANDAAAKAATRNSAADEETERGLQYLRDRSAHWYFNSSYTSDFSFQT